MRKLPLLVLFTAAVGFGSGAVAKPQAATPKVAEPQLVALLRDADGADRGFARIARMDGTLRLQISVRNVPEGLHGAHLHTVGECAAPAFASAGPHLNPHGKMHGRNNPEGFHLGDMPNVNTGADGTGTIYVELAESMAVLEPLLFDGDGTAVVIHAGPDDYVSDPAGNSGARIACGVLRKVAAG